MENLIQKKLQRARAAATCWAVVGAKMTRGSSQQLVDLFVGVNLHELKQIFRRGAPA